MLACNTKLTLGQNSQLQFDFKLFYFLKLKQAVITRAMCNVVFTVNIDIQITRVEFSQTTLCFY